MPTGSVDLEFPVGGLRRGDSFQHQAPYTTMDCLNVRPRDVLERRGRGGSRPGIGKAYPTQLGSGGNRVVRMLNTVRPITTAGGGFFLDSFDSLTGFWTHAGADTPTFGPVHIDSSNTDSAVYFPATADSGKSARYYLTTPTDIDSTKAYSVQINGFAPYDVPSGTTGWAGYIRVYALMDNSAPDPAMDCIYLESHVKNDDTSPSAEQKLQFRIYKVVSGVTTLMATTDTITPPLNMYQSILRIVVSGTTINAYYNGQFLTSFVITGVGKRMGYGLDRVNGQSNTWGPCISSFSLTFTSTELNVEKTRRLAACCGGLAYTENAAGSDMVQITASNTPLVRDDVMLASAERTGKLYIADYGKKLSGTSAAIDVSGNLADGGVADFTDASLGIDKYGDVVVVTSAGTPAANGTYKISSTTMTNIVLVGYTAAATSSDVTYSVERAPKVLDYDAQTMTMMLATSGQVPTGCTMVALYQDRIVFSGPGGVWYASRQGDPLDWDYSGYPGDAGLPIAGVNADAGIVPDNISALIAHSDDYLIFGCARQIWMLRGNPAAGGRIDNLSRVVGPIDRGAWCRGPQGEVYILTRDGMYVINGFAPPQSVSRQMLPQELIGIAKTQTTVTMEYDVFYRGVRIHLTPADSSQADRHWFFDVENGGFWPDQYPADFQPSAVTRHELSGQDKDERVMMGGQDGYIRYCHDSFTDDDGASITNYCDYGPFKMGQGELVDGILKTLDFVLGQTSGAVTWSVRVGESAGAARNATAFASGTLSAGLNYRKHPRVRGNTMLLRLAGAGAAWAVESINATFEPRGRRRKL